MHEVEHYAMYSGPEIWHAALAIHNVAWKLFTSSDVRGHIAERKPWQK